MLGSTGMKRRHEDDDHIVEGDVNGTTANSNAPPKKVPKLSTTTSGASSGISYMPVITALTSKGVDPQRPASIASEDLKYLVEHCDPIELAQFKSCLNTFRQTVLKQLMQHKAKDISATHVDNASDMATNATKHSDETAAKSPSPPEPDSDKEGQDYDPNQVPTFEKKAPGPAPKRIIAEPKTDARKRNLRSSTISSAAVSRPQTAIAANPAPPQSGSTLSGSLPQPQRSRRSTRLDRVAVARTDAQKKLLNNCLDLCLTHNLTSPDISRNLADWEHKSLHIHQPFKLLRKSFKSSDRTYRDTPWNVAVIRKVKNALIQGYTTAVMAKQIDEIDKERQARGKPPPRTLTNKQKIRLMQKGYRENKEAKGEHVPAAVNIPPPPSAFEARRDYHPQRDDSERVRQKRKTPSSTQHVAAPTSHPPQAITPPSSTPNPTIATPTPPPHFRTAFEQLLWEASNGTTLPHSTSSRVDARAPSLYPSTPQKRARDDDEESAAATPVKKARTTPSPPAVQAVHTPASIEASGFSESSPPGAGDTPPTSPVGAETVDELLKAIRTPGRITVDAGEGDAREDADDDDGADVAPGEKRAGIKEGEQDDVGSKEEDGEEEEL